MQLTLSMMKSLLIYFLAKTKYNKFFMQVLHVYILCIFTNRLKNFLQDSSSVLGGDILNLLYPVFVHMYIELLNNGHKTPGEAFISQPEEELGFSFNENLILKID